MLGAAFVPAPPPLCHPSGASPFSPLKMTMLGSLQVKARGDASSRHVPCWVPATNPDVAKLRLYRKCIARCGVHISMAAPAKIQKGMAAGGAEKLSCRVTW